MRHAAWAGAALVCLAGSAGADEWSLQRIETPARVNAIDGTQAPTRINAGGLWYELARDKGRYALRFIETVTPALPDRALPDGHIVTGARDIARVWLSRPTGRYTHGVLGDRIEAESLSIEAQNGRIFTVNLATDAVFEDLRPRLADLDGDGRDEIVVVKSYLKRGAALAVVGWRGGGYEIVAESPPLGSANRWLAPAGIADFLGEGRLSIAIVRQPHVVGQLKLWTLRDGRLVKAADMPGFANHIIGSRAIGMSAAADFNGDGIADLALPSLDRTRLRIVSFMPKPHEIANVALPSPAVTDFGLLVWQEAPAIVLGLADGSLAVAAPAAARLP